MSTLVLPVTLVAGANENINDLNSDLNAIVSWANGSIDATNLATTAKPATLLGHYRTTFQTTGGAAGLTTAGGIPFGDGVLRASGATAATGIPFFWFDPADLAVSGLTAMLRLRFVLGTNNTAPAVNFTASLYPVTVIAGTAGVIAINVGAATATTPTITAPALNTITQVVSGDFAAPAAGTYILAVGSSGTMAASSFITATMVLQAHHV